MATYKPEEISERLDAWASLPAETLPQIARRHVAWCRYVEARDSLEPGSAAHLIAAPMGTSKGDDREQPSLFNKKGEKK